MTKKEQWAKIFFLTVALIMALGNIVQAKAGVGDVFAVESNGGMRLDALELKDMDISDVLKLISQKSGLNIIAGPGVKGKVTVFLKNVEVYEALRMIVESYGWAYVQDGSIMRVMTGKEHEWKYGYRFGQDIKTEVFVLSYAKAEDISSKVREVLTPSVGTVEFDIRSNRIVISDTAQRIEEARTLIEAFDQKDREVLIEAKIAQVVLSDGFKLGVDWEAVVSDLHNFNLKGNFDILGNSDKKGSMNIGTIRQDGYTALVEALETVGHTDILSSPRITVINNKEAKILVGSTEPYVTTTTTTPSSGPATTAESVNFIEVGVKLFVTPTVHEDDFVTMKIKPEVSSVVNSITTGNSNTIPIVETSEAETTVVVKNNVTIVIGGLIKEEKVRAVHKIPVLGNIPVLGAAFRNTSDLVRKTEIVIFLTPKIVSGDIETERHLVAQ